MQFSIVMPNQDAAALNAFHSTIVLVGINLSFAAGEALFVIFLQLLSWRVILVTDNGATRHPSRAELIAYTTPIYTHPAIIPAVIVNNRREGNFFMREK